ncbi:helix-turn-helix transcriptional regulator [Streptomyces xinghaiensis]|uniref:XRE family transcriptional regulator n=1 Tax=Streptomyces xinghaiensis TaxID=1038928 RepID=A0A3R7HZY7_9ACTN|nr:MULTISPECIES: helix-turn-helix transcriptional regulator [Streptomyces]OFA50952.1 hypothetical protein BEN35_15075 [Streptomyces fradiae]PQM19552.1 XRE family transcriptional regulator [Streptomyces xinghaiensis]RKM90976.1 XRE family transcriptional regulator [Streptomyces xinghaiensis]RNC68978.1 XRE family transcriptional regulator [Streptomyces xinghaiensis]
MNAAPEPDESQADDLGVTVAAIDELLSELNLTRDAIDMEGIYHQTGIPVERIRSLLDGMEADPETPQEVFRRRLVFLRATRLKPGGKQYTHDEIADGAGISHGQVGYLLKGERSPGLAVLASLEGFFQVTPGFFTATERQALLGALKPIHEQLTHVALLKGKGITQLAMRSGVTRGESDRIGAELRTALTKALEESGSGREAREVRELTDSMLSLPPKSRRRIIPLIQGLLGLVRSDGEPATDDPPAGSK